MSEREQELMDEIDGYGLKLVKLGDFYQVQTVDGDAITEDDFTLDDVRAWIDDDGFIPFDDGLEEW